MKLESYWLATAPKFSGGAPGPVEGRADVVVIGGGFTGLSAALALARSKATVVVLEAGGVVSEASGRNGGQCTAGLSLYYTDLARKIGAEQARAFYRTFCDAVDTVEAIARDEAIACEFSRHGRIKLASKPKHYDALARLYEALRNDVDPAVELVTPQRIRDEIGSDAFYGGLVQSTSAQLHVGKFGVGLAQAAVRQGARIYESAAVTRLERLPGGGFRVTSQRGVVEAKQVLIATGSSVKGPLGWFRRRLVSMGSFVVVTEPLGQARLDRLLPQRRSYVTSMNVGNYFRTTPDDRIVFGGRARFAMSNPVSDMKSGKILRAALTQFFPELSAVGIDYCWGGLVEFTADRLPRAGEHDGMHYAMGYSGHGVQISVHMGKLMAEVMQGRAEANPWRNLDWPAIPGHFGKPWFLPLVGAYYRLQDVLH